MFHDTFNYMRWNFFKSNKTAVPPEVKSLAVPDAELFSIMGILPNPSGISVSIEQALQVPAASSAIRVIADALASLELGVKAIGDDGAEIDAPGHPVAALLRDAPNAWTGWPELIADLACDALIRDRGGLAHVLRGGSGTIHEVVRYAPSVWTVDLDPVTQQPSYRLDNRQISGEDVIHLRAPLGRAPLSLARAAIAEAVVMARAAQDLFGAGGRPSGALLIPRGLAEDAIKKIRAAWTAMASGSGRTAILPDGADFKPFQLTSVDSQFLESRKFAILEIARCFRVPPSMLFELDRATWSNTEQMGREFLVYCLEPWLLQMEAALRRALFSPEERSQYVIRFDRDDLTRADLQTRATTISSLIASRTINPNEGRAWLGLAPRDGGDEFLNPNISAAAPAAPAPQEAASDDA